MDAVTGATGFLGPHLVQALAGRGRRVRCIVRDRGRAASLPHAGEEVVECALVEGPALSRALEGAERVFHLAGGGKVSTSSDEGLQGLRASNVAPLEAVLHASRDAGVRRVVHFSSISAMGVQLGVRLDEDSPCRPETPHEVAKYESEQVALHSALAAQAEGSGGRVQVVVLRPSQIYGPGDERSEILKLVRLARRGAVPLFGAGDGLVPWVYVSDVVDATLLAAEREEAAWRTYIVSDEDSYRFGDVVRAIARSFGRERGGVVVPTALAWPAVAGVEALAQALGREPPFTRHRLSSMTGSRLVSIERARHELGYEPKVGLEEGVARTVRWYREQGLVR
jgi:nucleoside-diphosphate-sugar epimerase